MGFFLWAVVIGVAINAAFAALLLHRINNAQCEPLAPEQQDSAVIVLSVRGTDPSLEPAIAALLKQNFQKYSILVVVDNKKDPAWTRLQEIKARLDFENRMKIVPLENRRITCSLKCSSLVQAADMLPQKTRWVAFVDADVVTHETWLADVLGPLTDARVAVVTGNQWFEPPNALSHGAMLRSIWNAGALVPTVLLKHPWAGTMAMRYEDLIISSLIEDWKTSIVDDGPIAKFAKQMGGKVVVNPALLMVNRDDCSWKYAMDWIARMLTWSKIYERTFPLTVLHASISAMLAIAIDLCLIWAVLSLDIMMILAAVGALAVAAGLSVLGYALVRNAVSISLQKRNLTPLAPLPIDVMGRIALLMGPVQLCYFVGCVKAIAAKVVKWRGIEYRILDKGVSMVEYLPWSDQETSKRGRSI